MTNWGSKWRVPTISEFEELLNKCEWIWYTIDGNEGFMVKGQNGNSIFLPASGYFNGMVLNASGERGCYWSSESNEEDLQRAYGIYFHSSKVSIGSDIRSFGLNIRPVTD